MAKSIQLAVLTGDIVGSTSLSADQVALIRREIGMAADEIGGWDAGLVAGGPEFFRGDAWQLALSEPARFLRAGVYVRARLRALTPQADTRIAAGLGGVQRLEKQVSHSTGAAFTHSGRALDEMQSWRLLAASVEGETPGWLAPLLSLCGSVVSRWRPKQALVASLALSPEGLTQKAIGDRLGMTQQGVSNAVVSSELNTVLEAIDYVEGVAWVSMIGKSAE